MGLRLKIEVPLMKDLRLPRDVVNKFMRAMAEGKPILLYGPSGTGKTSLARAYAKQQGVRLVEINASDKRTKDDLEEVYHQALIMPLLPTWILLDEIDGIKEYGPLLKILKHSKIPIIMTANKEWEVPSQIKKESMSIGIRAPTRRAVVKAAKEAGFTNVAPVPLNTIPRDFRGGMLALEFHGDAVKINDNRALTNAIFTGEPVDYPGHSIDVWLLDNLSQYYRGVAMFYALRCLSDVALYGSRCAQLFPLGRGYTKFPRFYQKRKKFRLQQRKEKK